MINFIKQIKISVLFVLMSALPLAGLAQFGYVFEWPTGEFQKMDLSDASTTTIGTATSGIGAMDFGPNDVLYAIYTTGNELYKIDTTDASMTLVGTITPQANHKWSGLAFDYGTATMYAVSYDGSSNDEAALYTVDLETGSVTLIGTQTTAPYIMCLAVDDDGQLYGLDLQASSKIYLIDKTDGSVTLLGDAGFGSGGSGYGMDYCDENQTMYLTAYNSITMNNDLRSVDLTNGSTTLIANFSLWSAAIAIPPPLSADFTADVTKICSGSTVNFTNLSTGASSWSWTFEGGTPGTSTDMNPSVVYSSPGTYDVSLTVTAPDGTTTDTEYKSDYITVLETPAQADKPAGDENICTNSNYIYTTGEVPYAEEYEWEINPADAGTLTWNMNTASLEIEDWTGTLTIKVRATNMCGDGDWSDSLSVTVNESPIEYDLEGGGSFCEGGDGVEITLSDSQTDITYELYLDGDATGITVEGTGSEISFGYQTDAGYYTATGSNDDCTIEMYNQVQVIVLFAPEAPARPTGDTLVCHGSSHDYSTAGSDDADDYAWYLDPADAGTITANGLNATVNWNDDFSGMASLTVAGINDCGEGNPSEAIEITVENPVPVISGAGEVCDNTDETYEVDEYAGSTYTWNVTGGEVTEGQGTYLVTVHWNEPGTGIITVEEETQSGCTGSSEEFAVTIDNCTGLGENIENGDFQIYPNPAKNVLHIVYNTQQQQTVWISIYSQSGRLISKQMMTKINHFTGEVIDISNLKNGLYFVVLNTSDSELFKTKFIKN